MEVTLLINKKVTDIENEVAAVVVVGAVAVENSQAVGPKRVRVDLIVVVDVGDIKRDGEEGTNKTTKEVVVGVVAGEHLAKSLS